MSEAVVASILPYIFGGAAGAVVSSMLSSDAPSAAPVAPPLTSPSAMPIADDEKQRAARQKAIQQQMARKGRASTILTSEDDAKLGG